MSIWDQFLEARTRLIHGFHSRGDSDAQIAADISLDAATVTRIRLRTRPRFMAKEGPDECLLCNHPWRRHLASPDGGGSICPTVGR